MIMASGPVTPAYRYRATVDRVIDGDTYILRLDLGFRAGLTINLRVRGYDAPELHGPDHVRGTDARLAAMKLLAEATVIVVETYKDTQSFARWIGDVYIDGVSIVDALVAGGHVKGDRP